MIAPSDQQLNQARQVCLVFDSDSQYFACRNLVDWFRKAGWSVKFAVLGEFRPPATAGVANLEIIRIDDLDELWKLPQTAGVDAIGAYLPGSKLRRLWHGAEAHFLQKGTRPLLFTGYNGVVLQKFQDGISWRGGYDLIALNSIEDHQKAVAFSSHSKLERPALMPIIGINRTDKPSKVSVTRSPFWESRKKVVFAEQVLFPRSQGEKFTLYSHLVRIAAENPDWQVVVKPRTLPDSSTFHRQADHISQFISRNFVLPVNMTVCYDSLDQVLKESTVLLSISSTAFFDAIGLGVPSYTISDFGISSSYGTHFFHGSGCTICLSSITRLSHDHFRDYPSPEWLEFKGFSPRFSPATIVVGLEELIAIGRAKTSPIPFEAGQRLLGPPAVLPDHYLARKSRWVRWIEKSRPGEVSKPPPSIRRIVARFRHRTIGFFKTNPDTSGGNDTSASNRA